jgi:phenylacetate-CoA ligase
MDDNIPCSCGRGGSRLGSIEGRVQSIIIGANGVYVPGSYFLHLLKDFDFLVRQFQVIQEERGKITLKVVKGPRFDEELFNTQIVTQLYKTLGERTEIVIDYVDRIKMVRTGKQQISLSKIPIDFQNTEKIPEIASK